MPNHSASVVNQIFRLFLPERQAERVQMLLSAAAAQAFDICLEALFDSRTCSAADARMICYYILHRLDKMHISDIGKLFKRDASNVRRAIYNMDYVLEHTNENKELHSKYLDLEKKYCTLKEEAKHGN